MTINGEIKDQKLQYDINREATKISAILSGKIDKYEFLTGEVILPPDQRGVIEQARFAYSSLGKAFGKQAKTIEEQVGNRQKLQKFQIQKKIKNKSQLKEFFQKNEK